MFRKNSEERLPTGPEVVGISITAFLSFSIVLAYFADRVGLPIAPAPILILALGSAAALLAWLRPQVGLDPELAAFLAIVLAFLAGLLWLSWPQLLPPGSGADLTHHLQLIDYLDRHRRLAHEPQLEAYLGEMVHYTPGAHLLAFLFGRWFGSDGFHAIYPLVALSVAVKAGFVFLITLRLLPHEPARMPFAIVAVALLFLPQTFFVGSFTRYSYVAQVVSEMFAVTMWWALVVWHDTRSMKAAAVFAIAGAAVFLTWPVWVGPPLAVLVVVVLGRGDFSAADRTRTLFVATVPIAVVAGVHAIGRLGWTGIAGTDADMALPSIDDFNLAFLALSAIGVIALAATPKGRPTGILIAVSALQAAALFLLARANGAKVPYMTVKMAYLTIYPLAVGSALALAQGWNAVSRRLGRPRASTWIAWGAAVVLSAASVTSAARARRLPPTVTEDLSRAGEWARAHVDPACVDYIVGNDNTAYWLHLAVLGNRRMSPRTADDSTFLTREAILRWINPGGLPYAVADLGTIPKDVLAGTDELARFGSAVVIQRRGPSACAEAGNQ